MSGATLLGGFEAWQGVQQVGDGVRAQRRGVPAVERAFGGGACEVHSHDERVGVEQLESREDRKSLHEGAEGETPAAAPQRGPREPCEHAREVGHERRRIQPDLRQPKGGDVESHALEGGRHDDAEQREQHDSQAPEPALLRAWLVLDGPVRRDEDGEHEGTRRDELQESAPRVLGVREARGPLHEIGPTKEVAHLDDHKGEEQQIDQGQSRGDRHDADREGAPLPRARLGRWREEHAAQVSRRERGERRDHEGVRDEGREVDIEQVVNRVAKHDVGGGEQRAEDEQEGEGEEDAKGGAAGVAQPAHARQLVP